MKHCTVCGKVFDSNDPTTEWGEITFWLNSVGHGKSTLCGRHLKTVAQALHDLPRSEEGWWKDDKAH